MKLLGNRFASSGTPERAREGRPFGSRGPGTPKRRGRIILQCLPPTEEPVEDQADAIYLDHAATTPVRARVARVMTECLAGDFGNPSSGHRWGRRARARLEGARATVAEALGADAASVYFTRGGTESDNLAVLGSARALAGVRSAHVVTSAVEHPAVSEAAARAVEEGASHTVIGFVDGVFDMGALGAELRRGRALVSCMWVNNETGLRLPIERIADECRRHGARLHTDAVQAVGKIAVSLAETPVDMLTVTGHKIYGPKGTGALLVRNPGGIRPLHFGGGQEGGLRPGTEDVAGALGLAEAVRLASAETRRESRRLAQLRDAVEARLVERLSGVRVNAGDMDRAPHILSLAVSGVDADTLLAALDAEGIAASGGSACASGSSEPSPSLAALYPGDTAASLRLSFGRLNDESQVDRIAASVVGVVERIRELWG